MNRHVRNVVLIWLALSVLGILALANADFFPPSAAEQAAVIDDAFRLLSILAVPVAALVLTILGYSLLRFRAADGEDEDGPALYSHRPLAWGWFLVSTALVIYVVFNPGLAGLNELAEAEGEEELVVAVEGEQWHWNVTYPEHDLSYERAIQIALPVDRTVRFDITSKDVIHSFWIPAFRMKMDALPGQVTTLTVTPDQLGSTAANPHLRVQCAELCGTGHPRMTMEVLILEAEEFSTWIEEARSQVGGGEMEMDMGGMEESQDQSTDTDMNMDAGNNEDEHTHAEE